MAVQADLMKKIHAIDTAFNSNTYLKYNCNDLSRLTLKEIRLAISARFIYKVKKNKYNNHFYFINENKSTVACYRCKKIQKKYVTEEIEYKAYLDLNL